MKSGFYLGFIFALITVAACAAFPYKYYGIDSLPGEELKGTLLGKKPSEDLPLSQCQPDDVSKGKCVVMFTREFERLVTDVETLKQQLKDCQSRQ